MRALSASGWKLLFIFELLKCEYRDPQSIYRNIKAISVYLNKIPLEVTHAVLKVQRQCVAWGVAIQCSMEVLQANRKVVFVFRNMGFSKDCHFLSFWRAYGIHDRARARPARCHRKSDILHRKGLGSNGRADGLSEDKGICPRLYQAMIRHPSQSMPQE